MNNQPIAIAAIAPFVLKVVHRLPNEENTQATDGPVLKPFVEVLRDPLEVVLERIVWHG
jgi:hypothetical protein